MDTLNELTRPQTLAAKLVYTAFNVLKNNGGSLTKSQVFEEVEKQIEFDDWENSVYDNSKVKRWQRSLHFATFYCVKAGFLIRKRPIWHLTKEGENSIELGNPGLYLKARQLFRELKKQNISEIDDIEEPPEKDPSSTLDVVEQLAAESITKYIQEKNPYEFQDLVAALLRGMGYITPFVAPRGRDSGIDIVAYRDPLGIEIPRIKVQVKHRQNAATVQEVRQLIGIIQKDEVGIFVSTGGFTSDAKTAAMNAHVHIQLMDLDTFIELWQGNYKKLSDEDKALLPLTAVYFLAPTE